MQSVVKECELVRGIAQWSIANREVVHAPRLISFELLERRFVRVRSFVIFIYNSTCKLGVRVDRYARHEICVITEAHPIPTNQKTCAYLVVFITINIGH